MGLWTRKAVGCFKGDLIGHTVRVLEDNHAQINAHSNGLAEEVSEKEEMISKWPRDCFCSISAKKSGSSRVFEVLAARKISLAPPGALQHRAGETYYDEQICGGEMGEKEKQHSVCSVERGREEEMKMGRSGLILEACLPGTMAKTVSYRLMGEVCLPPRAKTMSKLGCFEGPVFVCVDIRGSCCHQELE